MKALRAQALPSTPPETLSVLLGIRILSGCQRWSLRCECAASIYPPAFEQGSDVIHLEGTVATPWSINVSLAHDVSAPLAHDMSVFQQRRVGDRLESKDEDLSRRCNGERMKIHEVILRAIDKHISWVQAAEIIRVSPRQLRR